MDGSFENSESDCIDKFIEDLVEFDGGFGELPFDALVGFACYVQEQFGKLPLPTDDNWEEVVYLASEQLIDDPEEIYE